MKRNKGWLQIAARAQSALAQHHQALAAQARAAATDADQHRSQAREAVTSISVDWFARRQQAVMDPLLDQAYVAFHSQLSHRASKALDQQRNAHACLDGAMADLRSTHGTSSVLAELQARRELELKVAADKSELQALAESWLLAQQHQPRDRSE